ncbi:hypothetical protein L1887_51441 [Cichorium endivia]|nr:hypothetical protein L1887_51441 [Cichorium endivia]
MVEHQAADRAATRPDRLSSCIVLTPTHDSLLPSDYAHSTRQYKPASPAARHPQFFPNLTLSPRPTLQILQFFLLSPSALSSHRAITAARTRSWVFALYDIRIAALRPICAKDELDRKSNKQARATGLEEGERIYNRDGPRDVQMLQKWRNTGTLENNREWDIRTVRRRTRILMPSKSRTDKQGWALLIR